MNGSGWCSTSGCLTQKHENQVELESVGEAQRTSEKGREWDAEQTRLIKDGQRLDHSHGCKEAQKHHSVSNNTLGPLSFSPTTKKSQTFSYDTHRVQRDPQAVSQPR